MELVILSYLKALRFVPKKSTHAIRLESIFDKYKPLKRSKNYKGICTYSVEDVQDEKAAGFLIEDKILETLITDFIKNKDCETLLVHCKFGINRSPAVAMALNDIFKLRYDSHDLHDKYYGYNWYIYEAMFVAAKNLGIKFKR